jgi:hypothetical protein
MYRFMDADGEWTEIHVEATFSCVKNWSTANDMDDHQWKKVIKTASEPEAARVRAGSKGNQGRAAGNHITGILQGPP